MGEEIQKLSKLCYVINEQPLKQLCKFRDKIVTGMRNSGVLIGGCGEKSIRLRPGYNHFYLHTFN